MAPTVQRHPLAAQAAELLLDRIRAGEWRLGARLPGETTLAPQLGVGRSTLREAIRELAGKGVLDTRQGAGVFVTAVDVAEEWDAVLRRASITAVLEGRIAIESEAARLAATRRTPSDLRAMRRVLGARAVADVDVESHVDADMAVHRAIVVASANPVLVELFDGFVPRVRQAMIEMLRIHRPAAPGDDQGAHVTLVDAIAAGEPDAAARLSRTHLGALVAALA